MFRIFTLAIVSLALLAPTAEAGGPVRRAIRNAVRGNSNQQLRNENRQLRKENQQLRQRNQFNGHPQQNRGRQNRQQFRQNNRQQVVVDRFGRVFVNAGGVLVRIR